MKLRRERIFDALQRCADLRASNPPTQAELVETQRALDDVMALVSDIAADITDLREHTIPDLR